MDQTEWEYYVGVFPADLEDEQAREFIERLWPDWDAPRHAPQTLTAALNRFGSRGWELVSMQPVAQDVDGAIAIQGEGLRWTYHYLCAFKRRKAAQSQG